jgi:N,N'-diacetyllegionaminate synthase
MRKVSIGNRLIGDGEKVFVIAEAGVNHNGSLALAKKLIDAAKAAGADAVKFQTFKTENIVTRNALKAVYQQKDKSDSQFELLKKLELSDIDVAELYSYAEAKKIMFLSSPFDFESVDLLDKIGVTAFKVASGEVTNFPLLKHIAQKRKPVILSSGMSSLREMEEAVAVLRSCCKI